MMELLEYSIDKSIIVDYQNDAATLENILLYTHSNQIPVIMDPHHQFIRWISTAISATDCLRFIHAEAELEEE